MLFLKIIPIPVPHKLLCMRLLRPSASRESVLQREWSSVLRGGLPLLWIPTDGTTLLYLWSFDHGDGTGWFYFVAYLSFLKNYYSSKHFCRFFKQWENLIIRGVFGRVSFSSNNCAKEIMFCLMYSCCICNECLDGVPFTTDMDSKIYCVNDYHALFAPICASCGKAITPIEGTEETVRVVSMDKDFHVDCYSCEGWLYSSCLKTPSEHCFF